MQRTIQSLALKPNQPKTHHSGSRARRSSTPTRRLATSGYHLTTRVSAGFGWEDAPCSLLITRITELPRRARCRISRAAKARPQVEINLSTNIFLVIACARKHPPPKRLVLAPNGDILTVSGADGFLVETPPNTRQVFATLLDASGSPPGSGALFGLIQCSRWMMPPIR